MFTHLFCLTFTIDAIPAPSARNDHSQQPTLHPIPPGSLSLSYTPQYTMQLYLSNEMHAEDNALEVTPTQPRDIDPSLGASLLFLIREYFSLSLSLCVCSYHLPSFIYILETKKPIEVVSLAQEESLPPEHRHEQNATEGYNYLCVGVDS